MINDDHHDHDDDDDDDDHHHHGKAGQTSGRVLATLQAPLIADLKADLGNSVQLCGQP